MENDYSNYDLIDRLISNERKAKSWTVFWITLLCILSAILIWAVISISEKNKQIKEKLELIENQQDTISDKNALIKSLEEDCNKDKAKLSDSLQYEAVKTITSITKTDEKDNKQNVKLNQVLEKEKDKAIQNLDKKFKSINIDFQKEKTKLFIHYNFNGDLLKINRLIANIKSNTDYLIIPPEFINKKYSYLIKCYNYQDPKMEKQLQSVMGKFLSIDPEKIRISYYTQEGKGSWIEFWIGSPEFDSQQKMELNARQLNVQQKN